MRLPNLRMAARILCPVVSVVLAGCGTPTLTPLPPPATPTVPPATRTVPPATATPRPLTATARPSATASAQPTPSPTPTITPQPTLEASEALERLFDLRLPRSECRLPCWLGFTPGQTDMKTVEAFFAPYASVVEDFDNSQHASYRALHPTLQMRFGQYFFTYDGIFVEDIEVGANSRLLQDGYPIYDDPGFLATWNSYLLPGLFARYGPPREVWMQTFATLFLHFELMLFYPDQSFLVIYQGTINQSEEWVEFCAEHSSFQIRVWPPDTQLDLPDALKRGIVYNPEDFARFRTSEEALDMTAVEFAQYFSQARDNYCLTTPAALWP